MKTLSVIALALISSVSFSQSIVGRWQLTDKQTCFQSEMKESETEKELEGMMGGNSAASVAKLIVFKKDGSGQEGIFSVGKKKGADMNDFQYTWSGNELNFTDKKSGVITYRFVIDELTETSLKIHDAVKACETKAFTRLSK